jgi:hypothetical protein
MSTAQFRLYLPEDYFKAAGAVTIYWGHFEAQFAATFSILRRSPEGIAVRPNLRNKVGFGELASDSAFRLQSVLRVLVFLKAKTRQRLGRIAPRGEKSSLELDRRHCEERSDEAIHSFFAALWIASLTLAMTPYEQHAAHVSRLNPECATGPRSNCLTAF